MALPVLGAVVGYRVGFSPPRMHRRAKAHPTVSRIPHPRRAKKSFYRPCSEFVGLGELRLLLGGQHGVAIRCAGRCPQQTGDHRPPAASRAIAGCSRPFCQDMIVLQGLFKVQNLACHVAAKNLPDQSLQPAQTTGQTVRGWQLADTVLFARSPTYYNGITVASLARIIHGRIEARRASEVNVLHGLACASGFDSMYRFPEIYRS